MTTRKTAKAFALLGIAPTQDQKEIRRAWRALVRTYHPDLAKEDRDAANRRLAEINEAFDILMAVAVEPKRQAPRRQEADAAFTRRMHAARRAEARRQAEAREAEAERRAYAEAMARKAAQEKAAQQQASRAKAASEKAARDAAARKQAEAKKAAREAQAEARRAAGTVTPSHRNPAVDTAVRAFSAAIASFSGRPSNSKFNTTC